MESCDNCNNECKHLSDCLDLIYKDMLQRCNINYKVEDKTSTERNYEQINNGFGEGVKFERLRRVTGYIAGGGIDRMNNAKQAEVYDRTNEYGRTEDYHKGLV